MQVGVIPRYLQALCKEAEVVLAEVAVTENATDSFGGPGLTFNITGTDEMYAKGGPGYDYTANNGAVIHGRDHYGDGGSTALGTDKANKGAGGSGGDYHPLHGGQRWGWGKRCG